MRIIQLLFFILINNLFIAKYCSRITPYFILCNLIYTVFVLGVFYFISAKNSLPKQLNYKVIYGAAVVLMIVGISLLLYYINPHAVQVDRWSAIHNFIEYLFDGKYPYGAQTHLGGYGSPFPVWQFSHIPFFLLGDVGLASLFSFIGIAILLVWLLDSYKKAFIYIFFVLISPSFWYEIAVRSDLIYNFFLCFLTISIVYKKQYTIQSNYLLLGILCGLFLSTRVTIVVPFTIFLFSSFFEASAKAKLVFAFTGMLVFAGSFFPLVLWDADMLFSFTYNPFVLQTRQGSIVELLLIGIISIFFALKWKSIQTCFSFISISLLLMVVSSFLHRMIPNNFENGLFSVSYDITYFNMALPFIIFVVANATIKASSKNLNAPE